MKTTLIVLGLLTLGAFLPAAAAYAPIEPIPVGYCVGVERCSGGTDACVGAFHWVPQCVDACDECVTPAVPAGPPLVSVCVEGRTDPSCYGYHSVCVEVSRMVPKCVDLDQVQKRCLDYYFDFAAGPVYYRQPSSCTRELYVNGDRVV